MTIQPHQSHPQNLIDFLVHQKLIQQILSRPFTVRRSPEMVVARGPSPVAGTTERAVC